MTIPSAHVPESDSHNLLDDIPLPVADRETVPDNYNSPPPWTRKWVLQTITVPDQVTSQNTAEAGDKHEKDEHEKDEQAPLNTTELEKSEPAVFQTTLWFANKVDEQ